MNNKMVIILGATCNLGIELCKIYAKNNYNISIISRDAQKNEKLKMMLEENYTGVKVHKFELDILSLDNQKKVYQQLNGVTDGIISLVGQTHYIEKINDNKFLEITNTNYTYLVNFLNLFLSDFEKKNEGFLICVSSVAGLRGRAKNFIYGSAKAALISFLSGIRSYFNKSNIFIMTVLPGFINNNQKPLNTFQSIITISPLKLAKKIYIAHQQKKEILYSGFIWKIIMFIIRILPTKIFKKINF